MSLLLSGFKGSGAEAVPRWPATWRLSGTCRAAGPQAGTPPQLLREPGQPPPAAQLSLRASPNGGPGMRYERTTVKRLQHLGWIRCDAARPGRVPVQVAQRCVVRDD